MPKLDNNHIARFIKSDRAVLIICIGIALIFWTLTRLSQSYKTTQKCVLEYNLPKGFILASDAPEGLMVSMEGVGWDLMSNYFQKEEGHLILNLTTSQRQIYNSAQLISKLHRTQSSIDIIGLNIDILELEVEEKLSKKVPISLMENFSFDSRYHLKQAPGIIPDSILLSGPESQINAISSWPSELIELSNLDKNLSMTLLLVQPTKTNISIAPTDVQMNIEVEQLTEKDFFVPVQVKNAPDSIKIFPTKIKISCVVGLSHYEEIKVTDFVLEVDMSGVAAKEENNTLPVSLSRQPEVVKGVHLFNQSVEFFFVEDGLDSLRVE
ncbi:MAG: hypothetical protein ACI8YQ_003449 [Polaribacter sp.]|jgi:hypothetical protein